MIDNQLPHETRKSAGADPARNWTVLRERMREIIRTEVDKLGPTDDARRALELIIESSLRISQVDGAMKITVVDKQGQSRTIERDGQKVEFTIHDLLDELRASHPMLFKPAVGNEPDPADMATSAPALPAQMKEPARKDEAPNRDWLKLDSGKIPSAAGSSRLFDNGMFFHLQRGGGRLHGWLRQAWTSAAAVDYAAGFQTMRDGLSRSTDRAGALLDNVREKPLSRRPGFALGAVAVAALLGIGAFTLLGSDDPPPPQASIDEPEVTGAIPSVQASTVEPRVAAPRRSARALRGVPDVIDTATLSLNGEVVRLFGVEWAPGAGKPEDMARYLDGREVVCELAGANDVYRCEIEGRDLSRVVLFNGGGKPTDEATPELKAAADTARQAKIGVWSQ